jgi:hypothetical protein
MAVQAPSKPPRKSTKGAPELDSNAEEIKATKTHTDKPASSDRVPMNFLVDADFRKDYRTTAAGLDMAMVDILKESFALWKKSKNLG